MSRLTGKDAFGMFEAYQAVYAPQQIDEISLKTKMSAFKKRATHDFESDGDADNYTKSGENKTDKIKANIVKKHGEKSGAHAERAAHAGIFGRKSFSMPKKPTNEELDIFDVVLEFLQAEGYAETLEEAEWMMANIIDEEAIAIIAEAMKEDDEEDEKEMKKGKKSKKSEEDDEDEEEEDEEELDEAIYSRKGLAKAAEMIAKRSTPSGRAKSGKGANVAHIRQIRGSGRGDFDREGLRGTPMTRTMAKNPIKKQNYVGTGNKAARRAGLTPTREKPNAWKEEFELWVDALVEEGYDLSDYTWDDMYEFYLDEAEKPFPHEKVKAKQVALRDKGGNALDRRMKMGMAVRRAKEAEKTGGSQRDAGKGWYHAKEEFEAWLDEAMSNYEKNRKRAAQRAAARNAARDQGKTGAVPGVGYVTPRRERETWTDESGKTRHAKGL
jgi:hypothetical protein